MPEDLILDFEKQKVENERAGATVREITMLFADTKTAGVLAIVLAPKDENGLWRGDVKPVSVRKVDDLAAENPSELYAASMMHNLILSAIVADTPTHRALGIVGLSVKDAAKTILALELQQ